MFFVLCYCVRRLHVTRCGVREEQRLGLLREESCIKSRSCLSDKVLIFLLWQDNSI